MAQLTGYSCSIQASSPSPPNPTSPSVATRLPLPSSTALLRLINWSTRLAKRCLAAHEECDMKHDANQYSTPLAHSLATAPSSVRPVSHIKQADRLPEPFQQLDVARSIEELGPQGAIAGGALGGATKWLSVPPHLITTHRDAQQACPATFTHHLTASITTAPR
jgi:hypothetical protein